MKELILIRENKGQRDLSGEQTRVFDFMISLMTHKPEIIFFDPEQVNLVALPQTRLNKTMQSFQGSHSEGKAAAPGNARFSATLPSFKRKAQPERVPLNNVRKGKARSEALRVSGQVLSRPFEIESSQRGQNIH